MNFIPLIFNTFFLDKRETIWYNKMLTFLKRLGNLLYVLREPYAVVIL